MRNDPTGEESLTARPAAFRRRADRDRFAQHASTQAIDALIADATRATTAWTNHLHWLKDLREHRADQIARGEWPPPPTPEQQALRERWERLERNQ